MESGERVGGISRVPWESCWPSFFLIMSQFGPLEFKAVHWALLPSPVIPPKRRNQFFLSK